MSAFRLVAAVVITSVIVYAWWRRRRALHERVGSDRPRVDEDAIRSIESTGRLVTADDGPLDLDEIEEEERRFWDDEDWNPAERL